MDLNELMTDGNYLPEIIRDFHDQKRLFKRIDEIVQQRKEKKNGVEIGLINWIDAHVYVIDFFLWYMARRGYTLQKSRKHCQFIDLDQDLREFDRRESEAFGKFLEQEAKR